MKVLSSYRIFDYSVAGTQIGEFVEHVLNESGSAARSAGAKMAVLANTHVLTEGKLNASFDSVLREADFVLPDGMPLVWIARAKGLALKSRVYGPDTMKAFLQRTQNGPFSHYFYGGRPDAQERMIAEIRRLYPGTKIAGYEAPPFRSLSAEEDAAVVERINASGADFVWVGLGCPKQEIWIRDHKARIHARMLFGVGQAFDIIAGVARQAPRWMGDAGLEWLHRLCSHPARLWKRYLVYAPLFVVLFVQDELARKMRGDLKNSYSGGRTT